MNKGTHTIFDGSLLVAAADLGTRASAMSANIAGYSLVAIGGVVSVYLARMWLLRNRPPTHTAAVGVPGSGGNGNASNPRSSSSSSSEATTGGGEQQHHPVPSRDTGAHGASAAAAQQPQQPGQQQQASGPQAPRESPPDALQNK